MTIGWKHSIDESGSYEGSSDAGIEHFTGDPVTNFAREGVQNSLDAANEKDDGSKDKVLIELNLEYVNKNTIPNINEFEKNAKTAYECFQKWFPQDQDIKNIKFFKRLVSTLDSEEISVFQFKDSNTSGMDYSPDSKNNRLFKFLKGKGISGKDPGKGGSFGIGKTASFAVSDLRTVFVSTVFKNSSSDLESLAQGKCQITSFADQNIHRSGTGYWGMIEGCEPTTSSSLPDWMQFSPSNQTGTLLSILGFNRDYQNDWEEKMSLAVIANYFSAILNNKLDVVVGSKYKWNADSLLKTLEKDFFRKKIEKIKFHGNSSTTQTLENTKEYIETYLMSSDEDGYYEGEIERVGRCSLKVKVQEGLASKVCFLRNGIKITDDLKAQGIKSFVGLKDFIAIFECLDDSGNELLRSMENPSHDNFYPSKLDSIEETDNALKALENIGLWVRDKLRKSCSEEAVAVRDIELLTEFFSHEEESTDEQSQSNQDENEVDPFGEEDGWEFPVQPIEPIDPKPQPDPKPGPNPVPVPKPNPIPPEPKPNPNPNPKPNPIEVPVKRNVEIINPRQIFMDSNNIKITFNTRTDSEVFLTFYASGEDIDEKVYPLRINGKKFSKKMSITTLKDERNEISLEFENETKYSLIIKAYEIS